MWRSCIVAFACIAMLLVVGDGGLAQQRGQDPEYDAFVEQFGQRFAPWLRLKPGEREEVERMLAKLRDRYTHNEWLLHQQARLSAERGDWQRAREALQSVPQSGTEGWRNQAMMHVYWRTEGVLPFLQSAEWRRYLSARAAGLLVPLVLFLYFAWRFRSNRRIIAAAAVLPVLIFLTTPYEILSGIIVAGAPFPITFSQQKSAVAVGYVLTYGTLLALSWRLARNSGLLPSETRGWWLVALAVALLVVCFLTAVQPWQYGVREWLILPVILF